MKIGSVFTKPKFMGVLKEVINDPGSVVLSNKDLINVINNKLSRATKVSYSWFKQYKSKLTKQYEENPDSLTDLEVDFLELMDDAKSLQRYQLGQNIAKGDKGGASRWILERIDGNFNLTKKVEQNTTLSMKELLDGLETK